MENSRCRTLSSMEKSEVTPNNEISYLYSIDDQRIYKENATATDTTREYYLNNVGILDITTDNWTWYVQGADRVAKVVPTTNQQPKNIATATALQLSATLQTSFYLYDHLGNTRIVYNAVGTVCGSDIAYTVEYAGDYFPYGKILRQYTNGPVERFLTTQHERDIETGLDYRGARFYDSDVARFLSLDPHAGEYVDFSPYCYVAGSPLLFVDANGKDPVQPPLMSEIIEWTVAAIYPPSTVMKINEISLGGGDTWGGRFFARLNQHTTGLASIEGVKNATTYYMENPDMLMADIATFGLASSNMGAEDFYTKLAQGNPEMIADIVVMVVGMRAASNPKNNLINELEKNGVKVTSGEVLKIGKDSNGKIIFLENGNGKAGLEHIMNHADDFMKKGISPSEIPDFVFNAVKNGKIVGYQGKGTGRPIYEFEYNGSTHKVAVTVGDNGFIVGANPVSN